MSLVRKIIPLQYTTDKGVTITYRNPLIGQDPGDEFYNKKLLFYVYVNGEMICEPK